MENFINDIIYEINRIDTSMLIWLNRHHCELLDFLMPMFTNWCFWIPLYVMCICYIYKNKGIRLGIIIILCCMVSVAISDWLGGSVLRILIGRLRPSNLENEISGLVHTVNGYRGGRFGFPSCHAANVSALIVMLSLFIRKRFFIIFGIVWLLFICYTRIYLGVHYPGDIIGGVLLGLCVSLFVYVVYRVVGSWIFGSMK